MSPRDRDSLHRSRRPRPHEESASRTDSGRRHRTHEEPASRHSGGRRSGTHTDGLLHPSHGGSHGGGSRSIRSQASRVSLGDHFATTRSEIQFDFDDESSMHSRAASVAFGEDEDDEDDEAYLPEEIVAAESDIDALREVVRARNFYDLLCLTADAPEEEIREAYYRSFVMFHPEAHSAKVQQVAHVYWSAVQEAFETLVDPRKRLLYDIEVAEQLGSAPSPARPGVLPIGRHGYAQRHLLRGVDGGDGDFDLGIRFDVEDIVRKVTSGARPQDSMPKPIDFLISKSVSVPLSSLRVPLSRVGIQNPKTCSASKDLRLKDEERCPTTQLEVTGSLYGLLQDIVGIPSNALADSYQPTLPPYTPISKLTKLRNGQFQPIINLRIHHLLRSSTGSWGDTAVDAETDVFPIPTVGCGMTKRLTLPYDQEPSTFRLAAKAPLLDKGPPRVEAILQRGTKDGVLLCRIESGDWTRLSGKSWKSFTQLFNVNTKFLGLMFPMRQSPRMELSYRTGHSSHDYTLCVPGREVGLCFRELEPEVDDNKLGSWSVSTVAEPGCLGTSATFSLNVQAVINRALGPVRKLFGTSSALPSEVGRDVRIETGASWSSLWDSMVSLRCLRTIGRFSTFGLEVGVTPLNLHLSLYWSRLGQSIRVPFLVCSESLVGHRALFWSVLVPLVTCAAWEVIKAQRLSNARRRQEGRRRAMCRLQRLEADEVTFLLVENVQKRQGLERANGGLVILSAKYGVKASDASNAWGAAEVADATLAVAALVKDGRLRIPGRVSKSNLVGFWDPDPSALKVLHIRYLYQGIEYTEEVGEYEELRLPRGA